MNKITVFKHYGIAIKRIVYVLFCDKITCQKMIKLKYSQFIFQLCTQRVSDKEFYTKKIDFVICTVKNTAHRISSDGDLMTKLLNRATFLNSNVQNNTLAD